MSAVIEIFEDAGEVLETVGKTVVKTVDFVVDKIVAPVAQVMGTVIQSAIDDPIKTVAQVAAIATQQYWALPLIEGADVAIAGGDLTDVAEATAKAYIMQEVGSYVGQAAGQYAGEAAAGAQYGTSGNQAAMLAAQEAGLGTSAAIASEVVGAAAGAAAVSVVTGKDPVEAFLSGGIGAAVPAILGQVSGFKELPNAAQRVISSAVSSQLSNQNVTAATINAAIAASGIVTDILNTFDPATNSEGKSIPDAQRKLDGAQRAILTDILMGTATTALVGGKPEDIVRNALVKSGSKALGEAVTDSFKTTVNGVTTSYKDLSKTVADIETNETSQRTAASNYNATVKKVQDRQTEANRLLGLRNTAVETYNTNKTQESYDAAQLATKTYNEYVLAFNTDYQNTFKPDLTKYGGELDALKRSHAALSGNYESLREGFIAKTDQITPVLDPIYGRTNAAMVETLRPDFNPTEYAAVNGLADNVDPYEHFLREGQYKGLPVNQDNAQALAQGGVKTTAIDKTPTTGVKPEDIFDGTNYDSKAAAQKAAVSLGRSYFTAPDGQTYKILSESEVKDKIKGASSFGEAFSMARQTLGSGATFEWTNPTTGKTSSFNTQTQEERAAAANKLSLAGGVSQAQAASAAGAAPTVGVPKEVTDYVSDKIIKNITDYDNYNPADLTKAEYARFINTYLNATEATRAELLKGTFGDSKTYGVIDSVLKQAPAAIRAASEAQVTVIPPGAISVSDYTNYAGVAKAAVTTVVNDTAGVLTRGFQLLGTALGMDTPTLDEAQKAWTENKDKAFSKLVGNEKVIGMGLASGIESIGSFVIGGPVGSVLSLSAITANNSWIEGTTAVIDQDGNTWSSEKEANANGKWEVRKLTPAENAYRTAAMTTLELAFETLGVPGMKQLVKGVPIGQGGQAFVDGIKRASIGMGSEQLTEFATTTAQFLVDKFASFGLKPNATLADYAQAVQDTIFATAVAVGTSGSIATGIQNLQNATIFVRERTAYEPMSYNTVVAETPQGERVTLAELITAQSVSDLSDPSTLAEFANLKPLVSVNAVLELGTQQVRLGDILTGAVDFAKTTAELTPSAVAEIMRQGNFIPDDNAVAQFAGKLASNITFQDINTYIDNNKVDLNEVKQIAQDQGLTLTDAQAQKYVQQGNQEVIKEQLAKELTPAAFFTKQLNDAITQLTTQSDAKDNLRFDAIDTAIRNLRDSGLTPAQVQNIVGAQIAPLTSQIQSIQSVVGKESGGNLPSSADVQAALETSLGKRAYDKKYDWDGDGKVTAGDVSDLLKVSLGRATTTPMAEGLPWNQPTGLYKAIADAKTNLQAALTAAQRGDVTRFDNIDAAIKNLKDSGLTTEQVQKLVSDSASGMSTKFQTALDEAAKGNTKDLDAVKTALTTQLTTLQTSVAELQKGNTARFDSLDLAIKGLKDAGLTTEQVQNIVDTASTSLSKTFRTALDEAAKGNTKAIADAVKGLATKTDIETAIANIKFPPGLSKEDVSAAITKYMQDNPGLNAADVTKVITDYMAANPPLNKDDVTSIVKTAGDSLKSDLAQTENKILAEVAKNEAAGLSRDAALQKAITDVATTQGKDVAALTKQITDSNSTLGKEIETLSTALSTTENKILAEVAKNEAAGLSRDAALQKAITDVATAQGKDVATLTKQITDSQSALGKEITALGTQLEGVEARLTEAITAARNAGLAGDAALQSAINTVAGSLGTTKEQLLTQLGTTESKLRTDFATQLGVVQQQVSALETTILGRMEQYEKAGIERDQALDRAIGDVATQLGTTRENILTRLGTTEAALRTDIAGAEQRLGARLGELTTLVGTPTQQATQQDLDAIINILQQQGAYDARYDYNGDRIIDEKDRLAVDQYLQSQQTGYAGPAVPFAPAAGTMWAPTGLFGQLAADQAATQKAIADQAEATRAANAAAALRTQRMGNLNTMMGMLSQAPDVAGQQVTVKAADPTKIGYVYDWSSIFANPQQQKMFMSPYGAYAAGGQVKDEMDEVNDELLKILRG